MSCAFYLSNNFCAEVLDGSYYQEGKICKEKTVMTLLFNNATYEDFTNPIRFLSKRIAYFIEKPFFKEKIELDYSSLLGGNIDVVIEKDKLVNETPYSMQLMLKNEEEVYKLPKINFRIDHDEVNVYSVCNKNGCVNAYSKKVNRKLYLVNDGFDERLDNEELVGSGNLKDITPSFVVVVDIFLGILKRLEYKSVNIVSILPIGRKVMEIRNYCKNMRKNNFEFK